MARRKTTPTRVLLAILVGWALPCVAVMAIALLGERGLPEGGRFGLMLLGAAALTLAPLVLPGSILWFVFHRLGVGAGTAAAAGGVTGIVIGGTIGLLIFINQPDWNTGDIVAVSILMFGGGGVGALTCFLMWKVAYPKALQPERVADTFA